MPPFQTHTATSLAYRPDIDGLRAVAVSAVILYHVWPTSIPGGFIGVDIFFVISGYLISLQIFKSLRDGTFSLADFYRRRIRRIAPAMLLVLLFTLIASELLLRPTDAEAVSRSGLWTIASMANVYFWLFEDTGYFAAAAEELPLLHYWSLGVEEQFYIVWPLILLLTARWILSSSFGAVLVATILASAVFGHFYYPVDSAFVYYMLPARAGELMIGATVARMVLLSHHATWSHAGAEALGMFGLAMVAASLFLVSDTRAFPGFQAVPCTVGTAMVILAGEQRDITVTRLLRAPPIMLVGVISYSAYLWHWPILAFLRYGGIPMTMVNGLTAILATLLFAGASYCLVERPFRRSTGSFTTILVRQYAIPSIALIGLIAVSLKTDGYALKWVHRDFESRLTDVRNDVAPAIQAPFVCQKPNIVARDLESDDCVLGRAAPGAKKVILFGDSNAAHYVGMLREFAERAGFAFRNIAVGSCPPVLNRTELFTAQRRVADCEAAIPLVFAAFERYDVVVLAADWNFYRSNSDRLIPELAVTIDSLLARGKDVIIIGNIPIIYGYDRLCREKAISFPGVSCHFERVPLDPDVVATNASLQRLAATRPAVRYYDANEHLCPAGICDANDPQGKPQYFNTSHLSLTGSSRLGQRIIATQGVPNVFERLGAVGEHLTAR
jgi:peptidoglycan/LPS O-acetylase OafA/YrhL